jgi:hypothetical protein
MSLASHAHDHAHDHKHEHAHARAHGDHAGHAHSHTPHGAHSPEPAAKRADPGVSLLRMSSAQRLAIASILVAAIWLGVFWAWA